VAPPPARTATAQHAEAPAPAPTATPSRPAKDAEIPDEGAPRPLSLPRPERARLACGAELLVVRRPRLPLATIHVVWPSGASDEPLVTAGLAQLTVELITEGAGARNALEVAAEVQRLGARLSTAASWDSTTVTLTTLTRALDPALAVFADVLLRPRFEAAEVERVRKTVKTSLLQLIDQPAAQAALVATRALYGPSHRYGELAQGSQRGLDAVTREAIIAWHNRELAIGRATIIAVGDVDLKSLRARLDKLLGGKRKDAASPAPVAPPSAPEPRARVLLVDKPGAAQTELRAYQLGPPRTTPDYFPLLVLNMILGGNFSSRLNSKLREQKGYTYGARSEFAFRRGGGPFYAGAPVKTAVTSPALADLRAELRAIAAAEVSEVELAAAKHTLERSLARAFETPPEVASALALLRVFSLPDDYFATYTKNIEAVSVADIRRVAVAVRPDAMALVFVGDEKTIGPEIKQALGDYEKIVLPK
jgi:predicted Zn-dependent peptidase